MNNINNILAALGDEINGIAQKGAPDPKEIARKLPFRSLTGDHINGGKIQNFSSSGITDKSTGEQLTLTDNGVAVKKFSEGFVVNGNIQAEDAQVKILKAEVIQADNIVGKIEYANDVPIIFSGKDIEGKGILWSGQGNTKQFIYAANPDRFFISENLDFARGKSITVNSIKLIDDKELGPTITKSNLREVGRLNGLIVDGSVAIGQYIYFDNNTNRLGVGTEEPAAAFSVAEDGVEVVIGTKDSTKGYIGTHASNSFDLVTDNTSRINISAGGNIQLGNPKLPPVQVAVHGKMSIRVSTPDPEVDLHVNGSIKFNNRLQKYDRNYPTAGSYNEGDIVWNIEPKMNTYVGWVCIQTGSPGIWAPFGKIGNS
jgi:hypothetical protein